jgi:hypothetical protein
MTEQEQDESKRKSLGKRTKLHPNDIADALNLLVQQEQIAGWPLPIICSLDFIIGMLMHIAHLGPEGPIADIPEGTWETREKSFRDQFRERAHNSLLKQGYKEYARRSGNSVAPFNKFLLKYVGRTKNKNKIIDAIFGINFDQSRNFQPKRGAPAEGVIIFAPGTQHALLQDTWVNNNTVNAAGRAKKAIAVIERAEPNKEGLEDLKKLANNLTVLRKKELIVK